MLRPIISKIGTDDSPSSSSPSFFTKKYLISFEKINHVINKYIPRQQLLILLLLQISPINSVEFLSVYIIRI